MTDPIEEMFDGYRDGLKDVRDEVPEGVNRSDAYVFGWRNGRDDRKGHPRADAMTLWCMGMQIAEEAEGVQHQEARA